MTESVLPSHTSEAIQSLEQDIHRLHESMTLLHELTHDQQPAIDSIQDAIAHSKEQVHRGQQDLQQAEEYQGATSAINRLLALTGMVTATVAYLLL